MAPDDPAKNIKFVKEIEKYPCLYNYTLKEYSDKDSTYNAWIKVAIEMEDTVNNCKEKWRNLRTVFVRRLKLPPGVRGKKKRYYLMDHMQFILPFVKVHQLTDIFANYSLGEKGEEEEAVYRDIEDEQQQQQPCDGEASQQQETHGGGDAYTMGEGGAHFMEGNKSHFMEGNKSHFMEGNKRNVPDDSFVDISHPKRAKRYIDDLINPRRQFLLSLLPEVNALTDAQMREFRKLVLHALDAACSNLHDYLRDEAASRGAGNEDPLPVQCKLSDREDVTPRSTSPADVEFTQAGDDRASDAEYVIKDEIFIKEEVEDPIEIDPARNDSPFRIEDAQAVSTDNSSSSKTPLPGREESARSERQQQKSQTSSNRRQENIHPADPLEQKSQASSSRRQGNIQPADPLEQRSQASSSRQQRIHPVDPLQQEKSQSEQVRCQDRVQEKRVTAAEPKPDTELTAFGRNVVSQLENLPREDALELQLLIQTLISGRRLRVLESQTCKRDTSFCDKCSSETQRQNAGPDEQPQQSDRRSLKRKLDADSRSLFGSMLDEYLNMAKTWAAEFSKIEERQQMFAKKGINDILYEGQLGKLNENSKFQINPKMDEGR